MRTQLHASLPRDHLNRHLLGLRIAYHDRFLSSPIAACMCDRRAAISSPWRGRFGAGNPVWLGPVVRPSRDHGQTTGASASEPAADTYQGTVPAVGRAGGVGGSFGWCG